MSQEPKWHDRHIEAVIAERDRLREENASQARELALLRPVGEEALKFRDWMARKYDRISGVSPGPEVLGEARREFATVVGPLDASGWQPPREGEE